MASKPEHGKWVRALRASIMRSRRKDQCLEMNSVNNTSLHRP